MSTRKTEDESIPSAAEADVDGATKTAGADSRGSARRELVKQSIFEHATRLFAERGFASTSFQDIADAVGLTRPALYHYVSNKDDLLARLVTETTEDAASVIQAIAERSDLGPAEKIHTIISTSVRRQAEMTERFKLLIRSEANLPIDVAAQHDASRHAILRTVTKVIESGIGSGVFLPIDARVAALGLLGMNNWVAWWYHPDENNDLSTICNQLADMAVASIANPDARAGTASGIQGAIRLMREDLNRLERLIGD